MRAIVFYSVAEYCDYSTKLTIKVRGHQVRTELWGSDDNKVEVKTETYFTKRRAYKEFKVDIGNAILGGWSVLNAFPKRETWETERSK
jgi:hypothetical protein